VSFRRNDWYVAALAPELGTRPVARTILGEPLVLWRTASGRAVALEDRCPHRGAPISSGEVCGEAIACGYHGFEFGPDGRCTRVPGLATVPPQAKVRSLPVIERWGWVFVWMGEAPADEGLLPDYHWLTEPGWVGRSEYLHLAASYVLVRDNLLDLTHARYVHRKTLGTQAVTDHPVKVESANGRVRVIREMPGIEPSPFFRRMGGFAGKVDHRQSIEYTPAANVVIDVRVSSIAGSDERRSAEFRVLNAFTPETECSTHYFWGLVRNFAVDDAAVTDLQQQLNRETFLEDVAILEAQQRLLDGAPAGWRPLSVPNDAGCVQAGRLLDRLIAAERGTHS
jgi:vanillate O-demethylase monooxygenase subunit